MATGQLIFLDDAGDPGFKFDYGSSSHFVIACVIFDDNLVAEEVALAMKKFRRAHGWRDDLEFKFNKLEKTILRDLLEVVAQFDFRIRAVRVDKSLIRGDELRARSESFYNFVIRQVLDRIPDLHEADVRLDGHAGRRHRQVATTYYRRQLNAQTKKVAKFRFVDSKTNNLIQLADIIAGSIYREVQDKTDAPTYVHIIRPRIEEVWDFR